MNGWTWWRNCSHNVWLKKTAMCSIKRNKTKKGVLDWATASSGILGTKQKKTLKERQSLDCLRSFLRFLWPLSGHMRKGTWLIMHCLINGRLYNLLNKQLWTYSSPGPYKLFYISRCLAWKEDWKIKFLDIVLFLWSLA